MDEDKKKSIRERLINALIDLVVGILLILISKLMD